MYDADKTDIPSTTTLMVIDTRIAAAEVLTRDVSDGVRVLFVDGATDAWAAIASHCEQFGPIRTLALFAHGAPGQIELGAEPLTAHSLSARSADFAQLRASFAPEGQVLLYACRVGAEDRALIDSLADHLGCDVAASSRLVGAAELGGSWDLDLWSGTPHHGPDCIWQDAAPVDYPGVLSTVMVGTAGELRSALQSNGVREIILTADITLTGGNVAERTTGNDVAIRSEGDNRYTINGNGQTSGLISLGDKAVLEIDNVDVTRFTGRVIESDGGYVNISNSDFSSNAGAISTTRGSYVNLYNASFDGHNSTRGGAIYLDDTYMVAINTTFTNNTTRGFAAGGAIYDDGDSTIYLIDVDFSDNRGLSLTLGNSNNIGTDRADDTHITIIGGNLVKDATGGYEGIFLDANVFDNDINDDGTIDWEEAGIEFIEDFPPSVSVSFSETSLFEDDIDDGPSSATITFTLPEVKSDSDDTAIFFEVLQGGDNDAVLGSDFTLTGATMVSGNLYVATIAGGTTTGTATITVLDDTIRESLAETIRIAIRNPTSLDNGRLDYVVDPDTEHTATIANSDQPVVSFGYALDSNGNEITDTDLTEGGTSLLQLVLDRPATGNFDIPVTISFTSNTGNAAADASDFDEVITNVEVKEGDKRVTVDLVVLNDLIAEDAESFTVTISEQDVPDAEKFYRLGDESGDTPNTASIDVTIAASNQDELYDVALVQTGDGTIGEGETSASLQIQLLDPVTGLAKAAIEDLLVSFQVSGTASDDDFTGISSQDASFDGEVTIKQGDTSAAITLFAPDNDFFEPSETVVITLDPISVREVDRDGNGRNYDVVSGQGTATVRIIDDDAPGVVIRQLSDTTTETGGTASFEITLTSEPTEHVFVALETGDSGEVTISQQEPLSSSDLPLDLRTLLFFGGQDANAGNFVVFNPANGDTPSDFNTPKTLIAVGQDDSASDGNIAVSLTPVVFSPDSDYNLLDSNSIAFEDASGAARDTLEVINFDDDGASVQISAATGTIAEGDDTALASYTIALGEAPTGDVTIAFDAGADAEVSVDDGVSFAQTASLVRSDTSAFTVFVRAVDDTVAEGSETVNVSHAITSGPFPFDSSLEVSSVAVAITDNDLPVVRFGLLGDASEESRVNGVFQLLLDKAAPADGLTVNYSVNETITGQVAAEGEDFVTLTGRVTFEAGQTVATIDIVPEQDFIDERPAESLEITLEEGNGYELDATTSATINITDDDVAGVRIFQSRSTPQLAEDPTSEFGTYTFDLSLTSAPTDLVNVTLQATGDVLFSNGEDTLSLTFDDGDFAAQQTITLTAIDNEALNDDRTATIDIVFASNDPDYDGTFDDSFDVAIINDDLGGLFLNADDTLKVVEGGQTASYTLGLTGVPADDVFIEIAGEGLTFSGSNVDDQGRFVFNGLSETQTITVTADNDDIDFDHRLSTITHVVTSNDTRYATQTLPDITVEITEDDVAGFVLTETDGATVVTEGEANSDSYTFRLSSQPREAVTVSFGASTEDDDEGEVSISLNGGTYSKGFDVTFDETNWDDEQTITIQTDFDDFISGDTRDATISHTLSNASEDYAELTAPDIGVSVVEDDFPGLAVTDTDGFTEVSVGEGDAIQIALTSEPLADVTVSFNTNGTFANLDPITFTNETWNIPVSRQVDLVVDPGFGIQTFDIELTATSADEKYNNLTDTTGIAVNNVDREALADGFEGALTQIDALFQDALDLDFPLFDLSDVAPDFISVFIDDAVEAFRSDPAGSFDALGESIEFAIGAAFEAISIPVVADLSVTNAAINEIEFALDVGYNFQTAAALNADFGIPALGVDIDGEVEANFGYGLNLGFGLSETEGFFIDSETTGFNIAVGAGVSDDFEATGSVGFLGIAAANRVDDDGEGVTGGSIDFDVTLKDLDDSDDTTRVSVSEITEAGAQEAFDVSLTGGVDVGLDVVTSLGGSTVLPSVGFELNGAWDAFTYEEGEFTIGGAPDISFDDITLDAGSFITDFASPIFTTIDEIVSPFQPIIDFLQTPLEPLEELGIDEVRGNSIEDENGNITLVSLAAGLSGGVIDIDPYVQAIASLTDLIGAMAEYAEAAEENGTNIEIVLGSYELDLSDDNFDAEEGEAGFDAAQNGVRNNSSSSGTGTTEDRISSANTDDDTKALLTRLATNEVYQFPIFTDVEEVFGLITGKSDVTLFQADLPELSVGGEVEVVYGFEGLFDITFEGLVNVAANLGFGFDTQGFSDWADAGYALDKSYLIFDGFYLTDTRDGEDIDELTADLGLGVSGRANAWVASGRVSAGIEGEVGVDFRDTGESLGEGDGKIRAISEIGANFTSPQNLFNLEGSVDAYLSAKAKVFGETVFRENISQELLRIEYGEDGLTISTAFDGPLDGAIAYFDANFNGVRDADEPFTISSFDADNPDVNGDFQLAIPLEIYDDNGNGKIDLSEGQIVVEGGIDTDTDDEQRVVYVASPEWGVVSPLTRLALELNPVDLDAVERSVEDAFGLPAGFDLQNGSPLTGIQAGDAGAAQAFALLAQVQNLIILGANTFGESTAAAPEELFDPTAASSDTPTERADGARDILAELGARVQSGETIDLTDSTTITSVLNEAALALAITPTGLGLAVADVVARNTAIADAGAENVTDAASGEAARAAIAAEVALDEVDIAYQSTLSEVFERLIGASTPEPDLSEALLQIETALDLPTGTDITTFNPVEAVENGGADAEVGLEVFAAQVKVNATLVQLADAGAEGDTEMAVKALVESIAENDGPVDLGDSTVISDLLQRVDDSLKEDIVEAAASAIAGANAQIDDLVENADPNVDLAELRSDIVEVQTFAQGEQSALLTELTDGTTAPETFADLLEAAKLVDDDGFLFYATDEITPLSVNILGEIEEALAEDVTITAINGAPLGEPILFDRDVSFTLSAEGDLTFDPTGAFDDLGEDDSLLQTISFTVENSEGEQFDAGLGLTLNGVNTAPVANDDDGFTTVATTPLVIQATELLANDTDVEGDTLTIAAVTAVTGGTVTLTETGDVAFVADPDFTGVASFDYRVTDPGGAEDVAGVSVEVKPEPVLVELVALNDWYNPSWGGGYIATVDLTLTETGVIGSAVHDWTLEAQLANAGEITGGWLSGYNAFVGFDSATDTFSTVGQSYQLELIEGSSLRVNVHVQGSGYDDGDLDFVFSDLDVNTAPMANNDGGFVTEPGAELQILAADLLANDSDPDGDPLVIAEVSAISGGEASIGADGNIVFTADPDFAGTASIGYTVSDGFGGSASASVSIDVQDPETPAAIDVELVSLNNWFNPSSGGGYIATFEITLGAGSVLGGSVQDWDLEAQLTDQGDITGGWLSGYHASVSFDRDTDTFTTLGKNYQLELTEGNVLRVNVQVDGSGYDEGDIGFVFRDLDPTDSIQEASMVEVDLMHTGDQVDQVFLMETPDYADDREAVQFEADVFEFV